MTSLKTPLTSTSSELASTPPSPLAVLQLETAILTAPIPSQLVIVTKIRLVSLIALTSRPADVGSSGGNLELFLPRKRTILRGTALSDEDRLPLTSSYHCPPASGSRSHLAMQSAKSQFLRTISVVITDKISAAAIENVRATPRELPV